MKNILLVVGLAACFNVAVADLSHSGHFCKAIGNNQSALIYSKTGQLIATRDISVSCPLAAPNNFGNPFSVALYFSTRGANGSGNLITCKIVRNNEKGKSINGTSQSTSSKADAKFELFTGTDQVLEGSHLIGAYVLCDLKKFANIQGYIQFTRD